MSPRVYIETSIVSYLTARPTSDLVLAARQKLTRRWWVKRAAFDLFASELVLREAAAGDAAAARRRSRILTQIAILSIPVQAEHLAVSLVDRGGLPARAKADALHIAIATVHGMDYLLTWNCRHIANASIRGKLEQFAGKWDLNRLPLALLKNLQPRTSCEATRSNH